MPRKKSDKHRRGVPFADPQEHRVMKEGNAHLECTPGLESITIHPSVTKGTCPASFDAGAEIQLQNIKFRFCPNAAKLGLGYTQCVAKDSFKKLVLDDLAHHSHSLSKIE